MAILCPPNAPLVGRLQKFGTSANGSVTKVTLLSGQISSVSDGNQATRGNFAKVNTFKVTVAKGGSSSLFQIELSTDGSSYTEVARIEVPDAGIMSDPDCGVFIPAGYHYRVSLTQSTAARASASLLGSTATSDITDV